MKTLKSLKEFEIEKSTLSNIVAGQPGAGMSMRHWGATATCNNGHDDTASWHQSDNHLTGEVGVPYWD